MRAHKPQRGFTLIELMLSTAIGLLIMGTAYLAFRAADTDKKIKQGGDVVRLLMTDAELITTARNDFLLNNTDGSTRNISVSDIINAKGAGEMPDGIAVADGRMYAPWGGEITMTVNSSAGSASDLLRINIEEVPSAACLRLLSQMAASTYDMYVDGDLVGTAPAATAAAPGRSEIRVGQAGDLCNADDTVTVSFRKLKEIHYTSLRRAPFENELSPEEDAILTPEYTRVENAMAAREVAQLAIP